MSTSHFYLGDCSRLKKLFEKASRNEPLSLVFLGASVTMAFRIEPKHQFLTLVKQYIEETYHATNIEVHNLGTPGMPSIHGLYTSYRELADLNPDLVVIDYSINDQKTELYRNVYESLLVRCLSLPGKPAVFSFFVQSQDGYTCAPQMAAVSKHYGVPYADIGSCLLEDIANKKLRWTDYSYDDRHPGSFGHMYIGTRLVQFLSEAAWAPDCSVPFPKDAFYDRSLANLKVLPVEWENTAQTPAQPLELSISCKILFLVYDVGTMPDWGNLQIEIDNRDCYTFEAYQIHEWDHSKQEVLYLSHQKEIHLIHIGMQPGDENKKFHIHCIGFV